MAFEGLTEKLSNAFKKLRGKGRLSEADVKDAMREIRVDSEGYKPVEIDLSDLKIREEETNTTAALIRGVAAAFAQRGYKLSGLTRR